jgi:Tol biopolymer transport system component
VALTASVRTLGWLAVLTVGLGALAGDVIPVAQASFPGGNGLIAFTRTTAAGSSIAVVEPDRSGFRTLIENAAEPAWSADGRSIAFVRKSAQGDLDIFIANADGSGLRELAMPGHDEHDPAWSPDGSQIVFQEYTRATATSANATSQVDIVNIDGSGQRDLTDGLDALDAAQFLPPGWPEWSPNGSWILYGDSEWVLSLIHPDGSGGVTLAWSDGSGGPGDWSPDGRQIAFVDSGCTGVCIGPIDGTSVRQLPIHANCVVDETAWSPDGNQIVFTCFTHRTRRGKPTSDADLYIINSDGSGRRPLVRGAAATFDPAWQPRTTGP